MVGVQVRDDHGVDRPRVDAERARVVQQQRPRAAAQVQPGVEQQPDAAGPDQVGQARLSAQRHRAGSVAAGQPLHQRQDGHLVDLTEVGQPWSDPGRPGAIGPSPRGRVSSGERRQAGRSDRDTGASWGHGTSPYGSGETGGMRPRLVT
jgi:hypothetical protein